MAASSCSQHRYPLSSASTFKAAHVFVVCIYCLSALSLAAAQSCTTPLCKTNSGTVARWTTAASGTAGTLRRAASVNVNYTAASASSLPTLKAASTVLQSGASFNTTLSGSAFVAGWLHLIQLDLVGFVGNATLGSVPFTYDACDALGVCGERNGTVPRVSNANKVYPNQATPRIDGEPVYGSTPQRAAAIRTFTDGMLKEDGIKGPPLNGDGLAMGGPAGNAARQRLTGSPEGNASPAIYVVISTLVREHNRYARELAAANPDWGDETLYQEARVRTVAMIQRVTALEFCIAILGTTPPAYPGYKNTSESRASLEFAAVGGAMHRSFLPKAFKRIDASGSEVFEGPLPGREGFYTSAYLDGAGGGVPALVRGLAATSASRPDLNTAEYLRVGMWPSPDAGIEDLARARDVGLASYGSARAAFKLAVPTAWENVTDDPTALAALKSAYPVPAHADLAVGLLAEKEQTGAMVGPLASAIIVDAIKTARDSDPFWYENIPAPVKEEVKSRRFNELIVSAWSPQLTRLPKAAFYVTPPPWTENVFVPPLDVAVAPITANTTAPSGNATSAANGTGVARVKRMPSASVQLNSVLTLAWTLLMPTKEIEVTITCQCEGMVGMGLGTSMMDADIFWFRHNASGLPVVADAKAYGFRAPTIDARQDITLVEGFRSPGFQRFKARRAWDTGDTAQDKPFTPGLQSLIFSWRESGTEFAIHNPANTFRGRIDFFAPAAGYTEDTGDSAVAAGSGASSDTAAGSSASSAVFVDDSDTAKEYANAYTIHSLAMSFTWGFVAPTSVFIVRYWKHHPLWLDAHKGLMSLVLSVTLPMASAAFASRNMGAGQKTHGMLGSALAAFVAVQVTLGLAVRYLHIAKRPPRWAYYVRFAHRFNGRCILLAAFANIGLGQQLMAPKLRFAYIGWLCLVASAFIVNEWWGYYGKRRVHEVHDALNRKKVTHVTPPEFERMVRLGSQWVLIGDRIFDISKIMHTHPGGAALLHSTVGQDISSYLYGSGGNLGIGGYKNHRHSLNAHRTLQDLCVAVLRPELNPEMGDIFVEAQSWTLIERETVCDTVKPLVRLRFACDVPIDYAPDRDLRYCGQYFEVQGEIGGDQVHRHYTCVRIAHERGARPKETKAIKDGVDVDDDVELEVDEDTAVHDLWIRRYPTGVMSRHVVDGKLGTRLRVRGPLGLGLRLTDETEGDLVAVVAGTGLLPLLDLVANLRRKADEAATNFLGVKVEEAVRSAIASQDSPLGLQLSLSARSPPMSRSLSLKAIKMPASAMKYKSDSEATKDEGDAEHGIGRRPPSVQAMRSGSPASRSMRSLSFKVKIAPEDSAEGTVGGGFAASAAPVHPAPETSGTATPVVVVGTSSLGTSPRDGGVRAPSPRPAPTLVEPLGEGPPPPPPLPAVKMVPVEGENAVQSFMPPAEDACDSPRSTPAFASPAIVSPAPLSPAQATKPAPDAASKPAAAGAAASSQLQADLSVLPPLNTKVVPVQPTEGPSGVPHAQLSGANRPAIMIHPLADDADGGTGSHATNSPRERKGGDSESANLSRQNSFHVASGSLTARSAAGATTARRRGLTARSKSKNEVVPDAMRLRLKLVACFETADDIPELAWLEECATVVPALELHVFVEKPPSTGWLDANPSRHAGRVDAKFLRERIVRRCKSLTHFYICGPPLFSHKIREYAAEINVSSSALMTL